LTDARALIPYLLIEDADLEADRKALEKLSRWCGRYTPWTTPCTDENGQDGVLLDITGCAHLFGGEAAMIDDMADRFAEWGLEARIAVADTLGAAWAVSRFGPSPKIIVAPGGQRDALKTLPVAALRLEEEKAEALDRLGLKRIGDLYTVPRAPLVQRFGADLARRLDQALDREKEPLAPQAPHVPYRARQNFVEPLTHTDHISLVISELTHDLMKALERDQQGARRLNLVLYRVDGEVSQIEVGTARPSREPVHLARLFAERLDQLGGDFDAGFGIETMMLEVTEAHSLTAAQLPIQGAARIDRPDLGQLLDRLSNRLGMQRITQFERRESHVPERAVVLTPAGDTHGKLVHEWAENPYRDGARPIAMLPCAEPVDVVAEIPEGPPRQFKWRRVSYRVARANGPERIAPEWWRDQAGRTRDYYCVEDEDGRRFWLYRDGFYDQDVQAPRWYVHGFFA
jgi:protein ImuB